MPNIELYYYPYSATDADAANSEDIPGGAGSVFVGGGVIKWHANVDTTISIDNDRVTLNIIDASVSDVVVGGDGYLQLIKHKISNQVSVKNGEFILLGGMMQQSAVEHTEGLPRLQKLPLLGWLFGQKKERQSDYEVMIMIRPSILKK